MRAPSDWDWLGQGVPRGHPCRRIGGADADWDLRTIKSCVAGWVDLAGKRAYIIHFSIEKIFSWENRRKRVADYRLLVGAVGQWPRSPLSPATPSFARRWSERVPVARGVHPLRPQARLVSLSALGVAANKIQLAGDAEAPHLLGLHPAWLAPRARPVRGPGHPPLSPRILVLCSYIHAAYGFQRGGRRRGEVLSNPLFPLSHTMAGQPAVHV